MDTLTLSEALDAELARARNRQQALPTAPAAAPVEETTPVARMSALLRTGRAVVTIRNPDGLHLVYRLRVREAWTGRDGIERPGTGYWMDVREGGEWTSVGIAGDDATIRPTSRSTSSRAVQYGAALTLRALRAGRTTIEERGRLYTLFVEDRCGRCGRELTDPVSIQRGLGPECYGKSTGSKSA